MYTGFKQMSKYIEGDEARFLTANECSNKYGKEKDWAEPEVLDWISGINVNTWFLCVC